MYMGTSIPVHIRYLRPHATQDTARLDGTTTTILEGPLMGRNVRLVVSVGVGEATQNWPRLDPFQDSRPQHPAGIQKSPMSNSGAKVTGLFPGRGSRRYGSPALWHPR